MGNCLVTKLKGVVDNPNLPILGSFSVNFVGGVNGSVLYGGIDVAWPEGSKAIIVGNGYFSDSTYAQNLGKELLLTGGHYTPVTLYVVPTENCKVLFIDNYKTCMLFLNNCFINDNIFTGGYRKISTFDICWDGNTINPSIVLMNEFSIDKMDFDTNYPLSSQGTLNLTLRGSAAEHREITGQLSSLKGFLGTDISAVFTGITGDIVDIADFEVIKTDGDFGGYIPNISFSYSYIHGRVESLMEAILDTIGGNNERTIKFGLQSNDVTLNGVRTHNSYGYTVTFNKANRTIALVDADNIHSANYANGAWSYGGFNA